MRFAVFSELANDRLAFRAVRGNGHANDHHELLSKPLVRRYHAETPELFVPQQLFTATDAIGFSYGVTWNTVRRNIFSWKKEDFEPRISRMGTDKISESKDPSKSV